MREYRVIEEDSLEIVTSKLHLYYDKKSFSGEGLSIQLKEGFHVYGSVWNYGDTINDLKGTARTLDNADGAMELEKRLMLRDGFSVLDDSSTVFITVAVGLNWMTDFRRIDTYYTQFAAGALVVAVSVVILFICLQKFYVEGMSGSVKG